MARVGKRRAEEARVVFPRGLDERFDVVSPRCVLTGLVKFVKGFHCERCDTEAHEDFCDGAAEGVEGPSEALDAVILSVF